MENQTENRIVLLHLKAPFLGNRFMQCYSLLLEKVRSAYHNALLSHAAIFTVKIRHNKHAICSRPRSGHS
jgi:hypothetical protein